MALEDDEEYKALKRDAHKLFLSNLMRGKNATEAYKLSFPDAAHSTAQQKGHTLKKKYAHILERHLQLPLEALKDVQKATLDNLALMAFADVGGLVDEENNAIPLKALPQPLRMAITEIEIERGRVRYKLSGKVKALEMLSRITRLDEPQPAVSIGVITTEERDAKIKEILVNALKREGNER